MDALDLKLLNTEIGIPLGAVTPFFVVIEKRPFVRCSEAKADVIQSFLAGQPALVRSTKRLSTPPGYIVGMAPRKTRLTRNESVDRLACIERPNERA